jgi:hypothetical protein
MIWPPFTRRLSHFEVIIADAITQLISSASLLITGVVLPPC